MRRHAMATAAAMLLAGSAAAQELTCGTTHVIQRGDTLQRLAVRAYGPEATYVVLWRHNRARLRASNPSQIEIGQIIEIPCLDAAGQPLPLATATPAAAGAGAASIDAATTTQSPATPPTDGAVAAAAGGGGNAPVAGAEGLDATAARGETADAAPAPESTGHAAARPGADAASPGANPTSSDAPVAQQAADPDSADAAGASIAAEGADRIDGAAQDETAALEADATTPPGAPTAGGASQPRAPQGAGTVATSGRAGDARPEAEGAAIPTATNGADPSAGAAAADARQTTADATAASAAPAAADPDPGPVKAATASGETAPDAPPVAGAAAAASEPVARDQRLKVRVEGEALAAEIAAQALALSLGRDGFAIGAGEAAGGGLALAAPLPDCAGGPDAPCDALLWSAPLLERLAIRLQRATTETATAATRYCRSPDVPVWTAPAGTPASPSAEACLRAVATGAADVAVVDAAAADALLRDPALGAALREQTGAARLYTLHAFAPKDDADAAAGLAALDAGLARLRESGAWFALVDDWATRP